MSENVHFLLGDSDSPVIDCEEFISALVRGKYRDGPGLAPEENEAIRASATDVLRLLVEAAMNTGELVPREGDMLRVYEISKRERFEPFNNLFFERESFLAFAKVAGMISESENALPERSMKPTSQQITVEELGHMVAVQRADQNINHSHGCDERDGVIRDIEIALQMLGRSPQGIPGVIPQIVEMARAKQITLHGSCETNTPEVPDISVYPAAWWVTPEDAERVLTFLCPSVRRYSVIDIADMIAIRTHPNDITKQRELRASLFERMEFAIEQGELVANGSRKDGELLLNEYDVDEWCARERFPFRLSVIAQVDAEQTAMEAAGRLTIEAVAVALSKKTNIDPSEWENLLVDAVKADELKLKHPRNLASFLPYKLPVNLRTFYDRIDIADVNKLLDAHPEWQMTYRFTAGTSSAPYASIAEPVSVAPRPLLQQQFQENEILRVIRELGENPKHIPKPPKPGLPGVKAAAREKLAFSKKVFDKAWERLRRAGEIAEA